jgi:hypothetical protein
VDGVSVVWQNEPPVILAQPVSLSAMEGGAATFNVGAVGAPPLDYQWYFQDAPIPGQKGPALAISPAAPAATGNYFVVVTNTFGAITSALASLTVEAAPDLAIVMQPFGDRVTAGEYYALSVAAVGILPIQYQWFCDGLEVAGATNRQLVFDRVAPAQAGQYTVRLQNQSATVWSLPATLAVASGLAQSGIITFGNRFYHNGAWREAPVFDVDGITRLSTTNFVAQLYAGPTIAALRAVGQPEPFLGGGFAGFIQNRTVSVPTVGPGMLTVLQMRAWDYRKGASYEEARALGGKFGKSGIVELTIPVAVPPPITYLVGLSGFSLQAGLAQFNVGKLSIQEPLPGGAPLWTLQGERNSRYLIERAVNGFVWHPWRVLTNETGLVNFSDPDPAAASGVYYRARILD